MNYRLKRNGSFQESYDVLSEVTGWRVGTVSAARDGHWTASTPSAKGANRPPLAFQQFATREEAAAAVMACEIR